LQWRLIAAEMLTDGLAVNNCSKRATEVAHVITSVALERLWDPQKQRPAPDPAMGRFYVDQSIAWVFLALVYLICLLQVFSKL
jgi:hypothetical protein